MPLVDQIAAIRADNAKTENQKRREVYRVKTRALVGAIQSMRGQVIEHKDFTFCINSAQATPDHSLRLDVTFTRPPANPVTHQITITNPPVLPAAETRSGNEKQDLIQAISEMLEGFV